MFQSAPKLLKQDIDRLNRTLGVAVTEYKRVHHTVGAGKSRNLWMVQAVAMRKRKGVRSMMP